MQNSSFSDYKHFSISVALSPLFITCFSTESASHFNCIASFFHPSTYLSACIIPSSLSQTLFSCFLSPLTSETADIPSFLFPPILSSFSSSICITASIHPSVSPFGRAFTHLSLHMTYMSIPFPSVHLSQLSLINSFFIHLSLPLIFHTVILLSSPLLFIAFASFSSSYLKIVCYMFGICCLQNKRHVLSNMSSDDKEICNLTLKWSFVCWLNFMVCRPDLS